MPNPALNLSEDLAASSGTALHGTVVTPRHPDLSPFDAHLAWLR